MAIAEARNLSHAANHLNVAQSALSHHLARMEGELAVALVERRPRGIELTPAGRRLYEHATVILRSLDQAEADVRTVAGATGGGFAVGLTFTVSEALGTPLLAAVARDHPAVRLRLAEGLSGTLFEWLVTGQLDLALLYNSPEDSRIEVTPLIEETMLCVGPASLLGEGGAPISFAEVAGLPLLLPGHGFGTRALIDDYALRSKLQVKARLEIESLSAMFGALREGLGCTILSWPAVRRPVEAGELVARPIVTPVLRRTLNLAVPKNELQTRLSLEVRTLLFAAMAAQHVRGLWPGRILAQELLELSKN